MPREVLEHRLCQRDGALKITLVVGHPRLHHDRLDVDRRGGSHVAEQLAQVHRGARADGCLEALRRGERGIHVGDRTEDGQRFLAVTLAIEPHGLRERCENALLNLGVDVRITRVRHQPTLPPAGSGVNEPARATSDKGGSAPARGAERPRSCSRCTPQPRARCGLARTAGGPP